MTAEEPSPRSDRLIPVEALDWRAERTWAVFLYIVVAYGTAVSVLIISVKLLILSLFGHFEVEKMESMRFAFTIVLMMAVGLLVVRYAQSDLTEAHLVRPRTQVTWRSRFRNSLWEWFLLLLWIGLTFGVAYALHSAFFAIFDFGSNARLPMGILMSFAVVIGTRLLRPFLLRWGQMIDPRDC